MVYRSSRTVKDGHIQELRICFLGSARYSQPLDQTSEKKFRALKSLADLFVIGFSRSLQPYSFFEHAHFYLIPMLPRAVLRYIEMFGIGPLLALWLIFRHKIRILIAQSPYEGCAAAFAKRIAAYCGSKVILVVESHGNFEESLFLQRRVWPQGIYRMLMKQVARFAFKHADLLRAISNTTRQQLEQKAPHKLIIQFPTWTDIDVFLAAGTHEKETCTQDIVYAGVLTPLKGVHHLVHAFACIAKDYPQARLIIVGREENSTYSNGLKHQAKGLNLDGRIQFKGEVSQSDLAVCMQKARVFVLPSLSEGLGRVVVEAMATGTPVIGSSVGGIREIVENGVTGFLVPPGDEKALTERLQWMLKHLDEAHYIGKNARAFAQRFFSTEVYVQGYKQVLEAVQTL